jgi:hypothetical protein
MALNTLELSLQLDCWQGQLAGITWSISFPAHSIESSRWLNSEPFTQRVIHQPSPKHITFFFHFQLIHILPFLILLAAQSIHHGRRCRGEPGEQRHASYQARCAWRPRQLGFPWWHRGRWKWWICYPQEATETSRVRLTVFVGWSDLYWRRTQVYPTAGGIHQGWAEVCILDSIIWYSHQLLITRSLQELEAGTSPGTRRDQAHTECAIGHRTVYGGNRSKVCYSFLCLGLWARWSFC